jgi:RHS repeat-associated protein
VDEDGLGDACDPCPSTTDKTCAPTTCLDEDGDGYGVLGASACAAGHPELFDCDDHNPSVHPGAVEVCDQVDNNCNGLVDDTCLGSPKVTTYFYNKFNQLVASGVKATCAANDADCDGVPDATDNCPLVYNPTQADDDAAKPNAFAQGALAVWGFNETSGTTAVDAVGGHDGTLLNGATRAAGRFGQGLKLDGVDDRVVVANVNRGTGAFSMSLWANLATLATIPALLDFGSLQPLMDTYNGLRVYPPSGSFGTVPTGRWTHLAYTWDKTTGRYYIDGTQVGTSTSTPGTGGVGLTIGARKAGDYPATGTLDEVAVFNRALTASEVQQQSQHSLLGDGLGDACDPCLGNPDPACRPTGCTDADGDGYGIQGASNCSAGHPELFDCDDHNPAIHPGAVDAPGIPTDNNCDGIIDGVPAAMTRYQWDGNGNLVSDGTTNYSWDARDRLVSNGYGYDTSNLRTKMGAQKVLLDGIEEAREYGTNDLRYDHDPSRVDGLLAQKSSAGKGYFVTDALGSVYAVVDSTGAEVSKYSYDVYGARAATSEGMPTSWGFTGRRHASSTEMYYRARYLDGATGRFEAIDPRRNQHALRGQDGAYAYVENAPTGSTDPSGEVMVSMSDHDFTMEGRKYHFEAPPAENWGALYAASDMAGVYASMPACQDAFKSCREKAGLPGIRGEGAAMYMFNRSIVYFDRTASFGIADPVTAAPPFRFAYGPQIGVPYSLYPAVPLQPGQARQIWDYPVFDLAFTFLHEMAHLSGAQRRDIDISELQNYSEASRQANVVAAKCLGML